MKHRPHESSRQSDDVSAFPPHPAHSHTDSNHSRAARADGTTHGRASQAPSPGPRERLERCPRLEMAGSPGRGRSRNFAPGFLACAFTIPGVERSRDFPCGHGDPSPARPCPASLGGERRNYIASPPIPATDSILPPPGSPTDVAGGDSGSRVPVAKQGQEPMRARLASRPYSTKCRRDATIRKSRLPRVWKPGPRPRPASPRPPRERPCPPSRPPVPWIVPTPAASR